MKHFLRILCVIAAIWAPVIALAHAQLNGTEPSANAVVQERPDAVELWFSEPVSPVAMRWISPDGDSFDATAEPGGKQVLVSPPPEAGDGSYLLAWRVVSLDGHPVSGVLVISVGTTSEVPTLSSIEWPPVSSWAVVVMKLVLSVCLVFGVGGTVYRTFVARQVRSIDTATRWALYLTFPAALLLVGAQGLDLLGLTLQGIWTTDPWVIGAGTSIVETAVLSALAAVAALMVMHVKSLSQNTKAAIPVTLLAWGLAAYSYAVSGHTAVAEPEWQAVTAILIHGIAMIFWLGALLPLISLLGQREHALSELRRFSAMAMPFVGLLLVTGFFMASIHAGDGGFQALGMSGYGILLFIKLVSVVGLLLVAAHNRLRLTPAYNAGTEGAAQALAGSIRIEIVLALMILAFASSFRLTPPPTTLSQAPKVQVEQFTQNNIVAEIQLSPGLVGPNSSALTLRSVEDKSLEPLEVKFAFTLADMGLGPIYVDASFDSEKGWSTDSFILPQPGDWDVGIEVLVTDFDVVKLTTTMKVEP